MARPWQGVHRPPLRARLSQWPLGQERPVAGACGRRRGGLWPVPARRRGLRPMACWAVLGGLWPLRRGVHRSPLWRGLEGLWPVPVQMQNVV